MTSEIERTLQELRDRFRKKFGRDPEPNDPVFFAPDSDTPAQLGQHSLDEMWERLADTMECRGEITAEAAYAMRETGMLVTRVTEHLLTPEQREIWNNAIDRYRRGYSPGIDAQSSL